MTKNSNVLLFFLLFVFATAKKLDRKQTQYDEQLSRQLMYLSLIAYAPDPIECLQEDLTGAQQWRMIVSLEKICYFKNYCAFYSLVSDSLRLIYIVFRGTTGMNQLSRAVKNAFLIDFFGFAKVNNYFSDAHDELWYDVSSILVDEKYKDYEVIFTGHSLGGALASISALRTVLEKKRDSNQVKLYTFGQPRVGNIEMARKHDELVPHSFRVVYAQDNIPHLPPCVQNKSVSYSKNRPCDTNNIRQYYHHGTEIWYSKKMSDGAEYVECTGMPANEDFNCSNNNTFSLVIDTYSNDHIEYFKQDILAPNYTKCYMKLHPKIKNENLFWKALKDAKMAANFIIPVFFGKNESIMFDVIINSSFVTIKETLLDTTKTTPLDNTATTSVDITSTTPLDTTATTSIDTTATTFFYTTYTTSLDTTARTSIDTTVTTSFDTTATTSIDTTYTTLFYTTSTTSLDTTKTTPLDNTATTSVDITSTTPLNTTATTSIDTTARTSIDTTATTSLDTTATTFFYTTYMTSLDTTAKTSLDITVTTSIDTTATTSVDTTSTTFFCAILAFFDSTSTTSLDTTATTSIDTTATTPFYTTSTTSLGTTKTAPLYAETTTLFDDATTTSIDATATTPFNAAATRSLDGKNMPKNSALRLNAKIAQIFRVLVRFLRGGNLFNQR